MKYLSFILEIDDNQARKKIFDVDFFTAHVQTHSKVSSRVALDFLSFTTQGKYASSMNALTEWRKNHAYSRNVN